jgi:hypothetical protein
MELEDTRALYLLISLVSSILCAFFLFFLGLDS